MCIAIHKSAEKTLEKDQLRICEANNPDGAGFAYIQDGNLVVRKGFMDFDSFWDAFDPIQQGNQCLVHFRVASAGNKDEANCHPWLVTENLAIIHNGTIEDFKDAKSEWSDTALFTENILKDLAATIGPKFFLSPAIHYLLKKTLGESKMVFLDSDGDFAIINEGKGVTENGVWYSNASFQAVKSNSAKKPKKDNSEIKDATPFTNRQGKSGEQRFGYIFPNGDGHLLSSNEILAAKQKNRKKLKLMVRIGIIRRVELNDDGSIKDEIKKRTPQEDQAEYELWLKTKSSHNNRKILETGIECDYAG